jgi:hypothetical protein
MTVPRFRPWFLPPSLAAFLTTEMPDGPTAAKPCTEGDPQPSDPAGTAAATDEEAAGPPTL